MTVAMYEGAQTMPPQGSSMHGEGSKILSLGRAVAVSIVERAKNVRVRRLTIVFVLVWWRTANELAEVVWFGSFVTLGSGDWKHFS
jgi:hypothetical protein